MDFPTPEDALEHFVKSGEDTIQAFLKEAKRAVLNAGGPCTFYYRTTLPSLLMNTVRLRLGEFGWSVEFKEAPHYDDLPSAKIYHRCE